MHNSDRPTSRVSRRSLLVAAGGVAVAEAAARPADRFAALEHSCGGRIGVAGVATGLPPGLPTGLGHQIAYRADERFPLCSTFKVIAASALLLRSAADPHLMDRQIRYARADLVNYSPITSQHVDAGMTVAALCAAALQYSDNTAANLMLDLLGGPAGVTRFARSAGDATFRLDRRETELNSAIEGDLRDTSTPAAMLTDLRAAALGTMLPPAGRAQLVAWMRGCTTGRDRIRAAAPAGSVVADKTGSGDNGTANDIAVIWPSQGASVGAPVVLTVYVTGIRGGGRDAVVAGAARIALDALLR